MPGKKRGPKPGTSAARKGGLAVKAKYGAAYYAQIGARGGEVVKAALGAEYFRVLGAIGGKATAQRHDALWFKEIARKSHAGRSHVATTS